MREVPFTLEEVRAAYAESRRRQGLPLRGEDPVALEKIATLSRDAVLAARAA